MSHVLPVTFRMSPLQSNQKYTPQQLADAIVARLSLDTQEQLALFVIGSVEPTSNVGPWLKDENTWMVWDDVTSAYVPQTITWKSDLNPKPWRGNSAAPIDIVLAAPGSDSADLVVVEEYDPAGVFDTSTFTAPDDGIYNIKAKMAISCTSGTPTDNTVLFYLKKNGFQMAEETVFQELGNVLIGRTYQIDTDIALSAGDTIKATVGVSIGGGSGTWTITSSDTWIAGSKIVTNGVF